MAENKENSTGIKKYYFPGGKKKITDRNKISTTMASLEL